MGVRFVPSVAPTPAQPTPTEARALPTTTSPEHRTRDVRDLNHKVLDESREPPPPAGPTADPRAEQPPPHARVTEHETVGRVWPERGLPPSYQQTGVRYEEGDMVGTGGSSEAKLEESMRWHRYGHDHAETTKPPPRAVSKLPFKITSE